jgi:hypothetical protein
MESMLHEKIYRDTMCHPKIVPIVKQLCGENYRLDHVRAIPASPMPEPGLAMRVLTVQLVIVSFLSPAQHPHPHQGWVPGRRPARRSPPGRRQRILRAAQRFSLPQWPHLSHLRALRHALQRRRLLLHPRYYLNPGSPARLFCVSRSSSSQCPAPSVASATWLTGCCYVLHRLTQGRHGAASGLARSLQGRQGHCAPRPCGRWRLHHRESCT